MINQKQDKNNVSILSTESELRPNPSKQSQRLKAGESFPEPLDLESLSPEEMQYTLHELQMRITELENEPVEIEGTVSDITDLRRTEKALAKSEEKFAKAFNASPVSIVIAAIKDGTVIDVNRQFLTQTGFKKEEVIGRTAVELGFWVDSTDRQRFLEKIYNSRQLRDFETQFCMRSGAIRDFLVDRDTIELDGKLRVFLFMSDITKRKRAEKSLRMSEEKYRTLIQKIHAGIIVFGADTRVLICNPMAQEVLGLREDQLIGENSISPFTRLFYEDGTPLQPEEYPAKQVIKRYQTLKNCILKFHRPNQDQKSARR